MHTLLLSALQLPNAESSACKLAIKLIYTLPTSLHSALNGQLLWKPVLLLAIRQVLGACLAAVFIGKNQSAALWGKGVNLLMIPATLAKICFL